MKHKNTYKRALDGHPKAVRKLTRLGVPLPGAASGEALGLTVAPEAAPAQAPTAPALRLPIGFAPVLGPWKPTYNDGVMRQALFGRMEVCVWPEGGWEAGAPGEPVAEGSETGDAGRTKADEWARKRFVLLEREPGSFAGTPRSLRCHEGNTWTVYNGQFVVGWVTETGWRLDDMHGPQGGKGPYDKNEGLRYLLTAAGAAGYTLIWASTQEVPEHAWFPSAPLGVVK